MAMVYDPESGDYYDDGSAVSYPVSYGLDFTSVPATSQVDLSSLIAGTGNGLDYLSNTPQDMSWLTNPVTFNQDVYNFDQQQSPYFDWYKTQVDLGNVSPADAMSALSALNAANSTGSNTVTDDLIGAGDRQSVQIVDVGDGRKYVYNPNTGQAEMTDADGNLVWTSDKGDLTGWSTSGSTPSSQGGLGQAVGKILTAMGNNARGQIVRDQNGNIVRDANGNPVITQTQTGNKTLNGIANVLLAMKAMNPQAAPKANKSGLSGTRMAKFYADGGEVTGGGLSDDAGMYNSNLGPVVVHNPQATDRLRLLGMASGGLTGIAAKIAEHAHHKIHGGQDDVVDAKLAPGEYIMDADTVSALGDGSTQAGVKKLDELRYNLRAHKRGGSVKSIPPRAKSLKDYMGEE